jgi:hypothetical protein
VNIETPEYNSHGVAFSIAGHAAGWNDYNP